MKSIEYPAVTIGVINYNGIETLEATLTSLRRLDYPAFEVLVVDNHSTDGSRELAEETFPEFRVLHLPSNLGSAAARNAILQSSQNEFVFTLDNDILLEPATLKCLMRVMQISPHIAACHPELEDPHDRDAYHYNGGWNHYLGALVPRKRPAAGERRPQYEAFSLTGGAALLLRREAALRVGGFDSDYFFNMEDGDFLSRLFLAGYLVVNVPGAPVQHRGRPRGVSKAFYQVRNRWFFILKLYSLRTILLSLPALLAYEGMQAGLLFTKGALREYVRGSLAALLSLPRLFGKRRAFRRLKVRRDRDWLTSGEIYTPAALRPRGVMGLAKLFSELVFSAYWALIRPFC